MEEKTPPRKVSERLDLSLYKGITKGEWEIIDTPQGGIDVGVKHTPNSHTPVISFTQRLAKMVKKSERDMADLHAIADVPKLISELELCYFLLDWHYKRDDQMLEALKVINDDFYSEEDPQKIMNFANDAYLSFRGD